MGTPILTNSSRPGQELESHLILASQFLATQNDRLTGLSVPLRLRPLLWAACTLRGPAGLGAVEFERETIQADRASAILKRMSWREHTEEEGVLVAGYGPHLARVWEDDDEHWCYQVDELPAGYADNMSDAKQACAAAIAAL